MIQWMLRMIAAVLVAIAVWFAYEAGHRSGRGQACFEVATNLQFQGRGSLATAVMSKPNARWDYNFWGTQCTITIAFDGPNGRSAGQWRFDVPAATLYAEDDVAAALIPAAGRWSPR